MPLRPDEPVIRSYDFDERLAFTRGAASDNDCATIKDFLDGCTGVVKTGTAQDRQGIDYIATLEGGVEKGVDAKRREKGCSRYWVVEPDLALEKWSVVEKEVTGWTLDKSKKAELILFTFDPSDWYEAFVVSAQHLRVAFGRNLEKWYQRYFHAQQHTPRAGNGYHSECVFVPVSIVLAAITEVSRLPSAEFLAVNPF